MEIERILPQRIFDALDKLNKNKLYELRLRKSGVSVCYNGIFFPLCENGTSGAEISVSAAEIENVIIKASGHSIYAVNDQIKNGYLALGDGVRMGICGEVSDKTIKHFSSINIRFPHEITGCANSVMRFVARERGCFNTLIVSPPGCGKTTLLRDLIRQLSDRGNNVLVSDERNELGGGEAALDLGRNTDVISGGDKSFAFDRGIRYMRPDILCADELMNDDDVYSVRRAQAGGVNVVASVHAFGLSYKKRFDLSEVMERIIVLTDKGGPGHIEGVYDAKDVRLL